RGGTVDDRGVGERRERGVRERRHEHAVDELARQPAAGAVAEDDAIVSTDRQRARGERRGGHGATSGGRRVRIGTGAARYAWYAEHAPSADTIVAPSGVSGVHRVANAVQSVGLASPRRIRPLMHSAGSGETTALT